MQAALHTSAALSILLCLGACSGGGGSSDPNIPASVPDGAGQTRIDMIGTWSIRDSVVIESNSSVATPPLNNTAFVIDAGRVVSFQGLSVAPGDLELLAGTTLTSYINQVDGARMFFSFSYDSRAIGGENFQLAVAGGAIDADTIEVEHYESIQRNGQATPLFTRSRYRLVRIATTPAYLDARSEEAIRVFDEQLIRR